MILSRIVGPLMALTLVMPALGACAGQQYDGYARYDTATPPEPGMVRKCFTPPNPGRSVSPPTSCWWAKPKPKSK